MLVILPSIFTVVVSDVTTRGLRLVTSTRTQGCVSAARGSPGGVTDELEAAGRATTGPAEAGRGVPWPRAARTGAAKAGAGVIADAGGATASAASMVNAATANAASSLFTPPPFRSCWRAPAP